MDPDSRGEGTPGEDLSGRWRRHAAGTCAVSPVAGIASISPRDYPISVSTATADWGAIGNRAVDSPHAEGGSNMDVIDTLVVRALIATVGALAMGVGSMVRGGE